MTKLGLIQSPAGPVMDIDIRNELISYSLKDLSLKAMQYYKLETKFTFEYNAWIHNSKINSISGLNNFERFMTFGVTHSIDNFIIKHHNRRFRVLKGEYAGTSEHIIGNNLDFCWLEDDDLKENDVIIISAPFNGHGNIHEDMYNIFEKASNLNIPVMVDCVFWGLCQNVHLNLAYPCIKTVAFSLSKCFWMNNYRIGMEYSIDPSFGIKMLNEHHHTARIGGLIGLNLFKKFDVDYLPIKYKKGYDYICDTLEYKKTNTLIFALSKEPYFKFKQYDIYNRVSISKMLHDYAELPTF